MNNQEMSKKLKKYLDLRHEPVAVKLVKKGEQIPEGYDETDKSITHCVSIMRARNGESLVIPADKHAGPVGASSLGLVPLSQKVMCGDFHCNLGMYKTPEAAAKMIAGRCEFEGESMIATVVCPLEDADFEPDVVIIVDIPETIYLLVPARTYEEGGRVNFSTASFQATCADCTATPMITGDINMSLGCYGCRRRTDMGRDEILMGIPMKRLEPIIRALENMYGGAIKKLRASTRKK